MSEVNLKPQISTYKFRVIHLSMIGAMLLSGCMVGPDFHRPSPSMPQAWIGPTSAPSTQESVAVNEPPDLAQWWSVFHDPELDSLIARAVEANLDLKTAEIRVREARASRSIAASPLWPSLDANGSYTRSGVRDHSADLYRAGLDASWELDIFGGTRRGIESADADVTAAVENERDVLVTLLSEVAFDYIDLRGFQREIEITYDNIAAQQQSYSIAARRAVAGLDPGLDRINAEASLVTTQSQIPSLEQSTRQTIYSLSLLLAQPPDALLDELTRTGPIPVIPREVPVGMPSELLRRRPDIRIAEAQLHSATAQIGVATSDWFPHFSLSGALSSAAPHLGGLDNWNNATWSIGPGVTWNIFDAGRITSNIALQNEFQKAAMLNYQKTVLTALGDVENSLIAYEKEQQRRELLAVAVQDNRRALDISTRLFTEGQTDFLEVLNAQRSLYATEDALVQSDRTIASNLVSLYKALGGGWESQEAPTTQSADPK